MNDVATYKFTLSYYFDPIQNKVTETRVIKRILLESDATGANIVTTTRTQILKARSKRYDVLDVPKWIFESIKNTSMHLLSVDITKKQFDNYMQKTFDLFELESLF